MQSVVVQGELLLLVSSILLLQEYNEHMRVLYLGGGCFWCTEAVFRQLRGVTEVVPGYKGGSIPNPSYEAVCTGTTGHAEVIKVTYDETVIGTRDIFEIFFATHDATTPNRQGNDIGSQYRSIIFFTDEEQSEIAREVIASLQSPLPADTSIVTEVAEASEFYPAEEYHYNYYTEHSDAPYCQIVIPPKLEKLQQKFAHKMRQ
jgi:peptide-methionine (S)-S-oxide reductase